MIAINSFWLFPWSRKIQEDFIKEKKNNFYKKFSTASKVQWVKQENLVFFFEKKENKKMLNIFLVKFYPSLKDWKKIFIIVANRGDIFFDVGNLQKIILEKGKQCTIVNNEYFINFYVSSFQICKIILHKKEKKLSTFLTTDSMNLHDLLISNHLNSKIELHWRFTLIFSTFIFGLIILSFFSEISRKEYIGKILISIFLFFLFFLLHIYLHTSNRNIINLNSIFWIEIVNFLYFFCFLLKNFLSNKN